MSIFEIIEDFSFKSSKCVSLFVNCSSNKDLLIIICSSSNPKVACSLASITFCSDKVALILFFLTSNNLSASSTKLGCLLLISFENINFLFSDSALSREIFIESVTNLFSNSEKSANVFVGSNSKSIAFFFTISPTFTFMFFTIPPSKC